MSNATDFGISTSFTVGTLRERSIGVHPKRTQHALSCSQPKTSKRSAPDRARRAARSVTLCPIAGSRSSRRSAPGCVGIRSECLAITCSFLPLPLSDLSGASVRHDRHNAGMLHFCQTADRGVRHDRRT